MKEEKNAEQLLESKEKDNNQEEKKSSKKAISIFIALDILLVIIIILLLCLKNCKANSDEGGNKEPEIDLIRVAKVTDAFKGIVRKNMEFNTYPEDGLDKVLAITYTDNYPNNFSLNISISSESKVYYCSITDYDYDGDKEQYNNFIDYLLLDTTVYTVGKGTPKLNSFVKTDNKITTDKTINKYIVSENEHNPSDKYIDGFYRDIDTKDFYVYQNKLIEESIDPFSKPSNQIINSDSLLYDYYRVLLTA